VDSAGGGCGQVPQQQSGDEQEDGTPRDPRTAFINNTSSNSS